MAGSISRRRRTTGWSGPSISPEAMRNSRLVADLAGCAGDGDVDRGLHARHAADTRSLVPPSATWAGERGS